MKSLNSKDIKKYPVNTNKIKGLIYLNGFDLPTMRERLGISWQYFSYILHGKRYAHGVRQRMANILKLSYEELWGERERVA